MKKILLILLCLPFIGFGQNVNIPDANFKAYLVGEPSINTNGDNEIQVSEANTFNGTINCSNSSIADLTGIDFFTNLYYLNCQSNQLTSLNVSQNTALGALYCQNNQLTTLDLSLNTNLFEFDCSDNLLTSLDVRNGNNVNMGFYDTWMNNGIGTLNNPYLSCINVDDSTFSANSWTSNGWYEIDPHHYFSTNCNLTKTYIPDNNFEQKLINLGYDGFLDDSVITAQIKIIINLDISNSNISDLSGIEDFTNLEYLDCGYNQLTTLDVSQSPALTYLNCSTNVMTSLNISQSPALEYLECGFNELTSLDVSQSSALSSLSCWENQLTNLDVSQNTSLTELYCAMNQLTSLDVRNGNNTNLTNFWSDNNPNLSCINVDNIAWATTNWISIDPQHYFSNNCSVTAKQEQTTNKELLKVTDLLGRETKQTNQPLLYLYDDGTVEKRIVIE